MKQISLYHGDAIKEMAKLPEGSVDLILVDLPYGTTNNKWDVVIPFDKMWEQFYRVAKESAAVVLTATQPFTSKLLCSNFKDFRYDWIWEKTQGSGQLNVNKMPLRAHEHILVFYRKLGTYNEQRLPGEPYTVHRKATWKTQSYGKQKDHITVNDGYRNARSVIKMGNQRAKGNHPTQKPEELMEYFVKVYSNPGEVILDCCVGSGTTGVAAVKWGRKFIGIELDEKYFESAKERIESTPRSLLIEVPKK